MSTGHAHIFVKTLRETIPVDLPSQHAGPDSSRSGPWYSLDWSNGSNVILRQAERSMGTGPPRQTSEPLSEDALSG